MDTVRRYLQNPSEARIRPKSGGSRLIRILILTQWFQPEPNFKGLPFARELMARGHDVQVITGFPNYPGGRLYPGYRLRLMRREVMDGVPVVRLPLYPSHDRSAIRRVLNYVSFGVSAALAIPFLAKSADIAYVYHPPGTIGLPALALRAIRRTPFVLDVQDLWPDTLAATGMMGDKRILAVVDAWMRLVYRSARRIAVLSPGFKEALIDRGVPGEKVEVIYNWTEEPDRPVQGQGKSAGPLEPGRFNIVFAGTAGRAQGLKSVIDAAALLQDHQPNVRIVLVGGGVEREELQRRADHLAITNVTFLPRVSRSEVDGILAASDALLVHLRDDPLFEITIPGKTQASLAAGRPILMAVKGDAARLVETAGAGVSCSPEDPRSIADAVGVLCAMTRDQRERMGRNGRRFYERELSLQAGVQRFEDCFASAIGNHPAVRAEHAHEAISGNRDNDD